MRGLPQGAWRSLAERLELDPTVRIKRLSRGNRQKIGVDRGVHGPGPAARARRADQRPGPADAARVPGARRRGAGRGPDGVPVAATTWSRSSGPATASRSSATAGSWTSAPSASCWAPTGARSTCVLAEPAPRRLRPAERQVAAMTGREVHLMVRGDVNPLLDRIAAHRRRWTSRSPRRTSRTCSCATTARTTTAAEPRQGFDTGPRPPRMRLRHSPADTAPRGGAPMTRLPPRAPPQPRPHRVAGDHAPRLRRRDGPDAPDHARERRADARSTWTSSRRSSWPRSA